MRVDTNQLLEWINTLSHAAMYLQEGQVSNCKLGIFDVVKQLEAIVGDDLPGLPYATLSEGPDTFDGCSADGFIDGCKRMGCHDATEEAKLIEKRRLNVAAKNLHGYVAQMGLNPSHSLVYVYAELWMKTTTPSESEALVEEFIRAALIQRRQRRG